MAAANARNAPSPSTIGTLVEAMESFAPVALAEEWDNAGLILGSKADELRGPVMLTIDLTDGVLDEALGAGCSAIIAYHPPIFRPIKRLVDETPLGRVLLRAARAGLAVYSPHTALDAAQRGMTDWLADRVLANGSASSNDHGAKSADRRALRPAETIPATEQLKIVTFVPKEALERVRDGLASAGAGRIGAYSVCSFAVEGVGTFLGDQSTKPAVGRPGQLESTREHRLEMVCSKQSLALAIRTLRQFHPYEEPAIDVIELHARPGRDVGLGRRLVLDKQETIDAIAARLKANLGLGVVSVAKVQDGPVSVIGVCPGSGGELADLALAEGCQLFVTGEMKHHEVLAATARGLSIILCGHTNTERGYLPALANELSRRLPSVRFEVSRKDADPQRPA